MFKDAYYGNPSADVTNSDAVVGYQLRTPLVSNLSHIKDFIKNYENKNTPVIIKDEYNHEKMHHKINLRRELNKIQSDLNRLEKMLEEEKEGKEGKELFQNMKCTSLD